MVELAKSDTKEPAVVTGKPRIHVAPKTLASEVGTMRIKIIQKGWETFSGDFGQVIFENGVSVKPLTEVYIDRVATQIRVVDLETGLQVGPTQRMIDGRATRLEASKGLKTATAEQIAAANKPLADQATIAVSKKFYSYDQLCKIVDKDGIGGLRSIGDTLGVKGRAIPELIKVILSAQDLIRDRETGTRVATTTKDTQAVLGE